MGAINNITTVKLTNLPCRDVGKQKTVRIAIGGVPQNYNYTVPPSNPIYAHFYEDEQQFKESISPYDYITFKSLKEVDQQRLLNLMQKDFIITEDAMQNILLELFGYKKQHPEYKFVRLTLIQ